MSSNNTQKKSNDILNNFPIFIFNLSDIFLLLKFLNPNLNNWINNLNNKMNCNYLSSFSQGYDQPNTPPRKPSAHHCNAERKNNPFKTLRENDLAPLSRNLFGNFEGGTMYNSGNNSAQLRSFR